MDAEPYDEVLINAAIWKLDADREERERRRMEQNSQRHGRAL